MKEIERWVDRESRRQGHWDKHLKQSRKVSFDDSIKVYSDYYQNTTAQEDTYNYSQIHTETRHEELVQPGEQLTNMVYDSKTIKYITFEQFVGLNEINLNSSKTKTINTKTKFNESSSTNT